MSKHISSPRDLTLTARQPNTNGGMDWPSARIALSGNESTGSCPMQKFHPGGSMVYLKLYASALTLKKRTIWEFTWTTPQAVASATIWLSCLGVDPEKARSETRTQIVRVPVAPHTVRAEAGPAQLVPTRSPCPGFPWLNRPICALFIQLRCLCLRR